MKRLAGNVLAAIQRRKLFYSLKNRVTAVFLLSSLITFSLVSAASYYTIYSILYNKIGKNIQLTLDQVSRDTGLAMDNLLSVAAQLSVSSQLSNGGAVINDLANFLSTNSYSSKRTHYDNIVTYLNLIDYTNPTAGLHFYYRPTARSRRSRITFPFSWFATTISSR